MPRSRSTAISTAVPVRRAATLAAFAALAALAALAGALCSPSLARAQAAATQERTHTVRPGDTLWDLARLYLSNPYLWPEIFRVNGGVVRDPHLIFPGERLRIPVGSDGSGGDPAEPSGHGPSGHAVRSRVEPTIFAIRERATAPAAAPVAPGGPRQEPRRAVREGEVYAAPWVDRRGGPARQGKLIASAAEVGVSVVEGSSRLQLHDRAYVTLPPGDASQVGDRLVLIALGPHLGADGQAVIPTGIAEVERRGAGEATTIRIIRQFDEIRIGQGVISMQRLPIPADTAAAPPSPGVASRVAWIPSGAVLPSLQSYVVLEATLRDGLAIGDEFTLVRPQARTDEGVVLPEEPIALVQVVRVTERGATGIILDQRHPRIRVGTHARLTAKMP